MNTFFKRPTPRGYVVYRQDEPQFVVEQGDKGTHDNCIALIPMKRYTELLDEQIEETKNDKTELT